MEGGECDLECVHSFCQLSESLGNVGVGDSAFACTSRLFLVLLLESVDEIGKQKVDRGGDSSEI